MTTQAKLQEKITEEVSKFEKTMDELRFLERVSQDLRNYKRMIELRRYD